MKYVLHDISITCYMILVSSVRHLGPANFLLISPTRPLFPRRINGQGSAARRARPFRAGRISLTAWACRLGG